MASPTNTAQNKWQTPPLEDYLQLVSSNGGIVFGGINSLGQPYGSLSTNAAGTLTAPAITLSLTTSAPGNFTVAHGLGATPKAGIMMMTSGGSIYWQSARWDGTNVYLIATDTGLTADLLLWI